MTVAVCMILYNEADTMGRALESARRLADEIVVVDNGSTDGTPDIARKYGARVLINPDRSSKSALRNQAQDAATGRWVVTLDGDEEIENPDGPDGLRYHLISGENRLVWLRITAPSTGFAFHQARAWPRGTFRYRYRAHEAPFSVDGVQLPNDYASFRLLHHQPPGRWSAKLKPTRARLELDVKENPGDPRPLFYLARQYYYLGERDRAVETFDQYFEQDRRNDDADAFNFLGLCHREARRFGAAADCFHRACGAAPRRREFWVNLANLYREQGRNNEAAAVLICAKHMPAPEHGYFEATWHHGPRLDDLIARALWYAGRVEEGRPYADAAMAAAPEGHPDHAWIVRNHDFFVRAMNDVHNA